MKNYRIYLNECGLEHLGTVNSIECVVGVLEGLGFENFIVIEHDTVANCDDIVTYKIREILKEKENVSRGTQKVYTRKKL